MVTQLLFRIVEQHQEVYEQNSIEKIARFWKTEPTKDVDKRSFCLFRPIKVWNVPSELGHTLLATIIHTPTWSFLVAMS